MSTDTVTVELARENAQKLLDAAPSDGIEPLRPMRPEQHELLDALETALSQPQHKGEGRGEVRYLKFEDGQSFDLRWDFFLCPSHGLIAPSKFDSEWNTDYGCPVPTYKEEPCDEKLTPVFLDSLFEAAFRDTANLSGEGEPRARIAAVIATCKRAEGDLAKAAAQGDPDAQGQSQAFQYVRELLEEELPLEMQPGEGLTVSAVKAALLSREAADEVADEFTEGEEGIHPDFVRSIAEVLLRTIPFERLTKGAGLTVEAVREFADRRRDECNAGALQLGGTSPLGRERTAEARAFGSVVNFIDAERSVAATFPETKEDQP